MNKDQLKAAFAKGARIQAWHLLPGATNSNQGQWDTLTPKGDAEPEFGCEAHLYRVHPEDLSLIAELGQEVGAVAWQHQVADALSCFWNAAIGADVTRYDPTAAACASAIAQGFAAVEQRLREFAPQSSPAHTSEARDSVMLDWLEKATTGGSVEMTFSHSDVRKLRGMGSVRQCCDAAMRQEGGNG